MEHRALSKEIPPLDLLAAAGVVFLTLDGRGKMVSVFGAVEPSSGWTVQAILGRPFTDFVAPEYHEGALERVRKLIAGEIQVSSGSLCILDREGRRLGLHCTSRAVRDALGHMSLEVVCYPCPLLRDQLPALGEPGAAPILTPRQLQVLRLLGEGLNTKAIASRLTISEETTRNHIRRILRELDCHSRLEAVAKARRLGLI